MTLFPAASNHLISASAKHLVSLSALSLLTLAISACTGTSTSSSSEPQNNGSSTAPVSSSSLAVSSAPLSSAPVVSSLAASSIAVSSIAVSSINAVSSQTVSSAASSSIAPLPPIAGEASAYEKYFQPLVEGQCRLCHSEQYNIKQSPMFAHEQAIIGERELVATGKISFSEPEQSRIVQKIGNLPLHNCGSTLAECQTLANTMVAAIKRWREESGNSLFNQQSPLASGSVKLTQAFNKPSATQRDNTGAIALYDFVNCTTSTAPDESDVQPLQPMTLVGGAECLPNEGLQVPVTGYAIADDSSLKVFNALNNSAVGYSIEFWFSSFNDDGGSLVSMHADQSDVDENGVPTRTPVNLDINVRVTRSSSQVSGGLRHSHRNAASGPYAIQNNVVSFASSEAILPGVLNHVVITVPRGGERSMYLNGVALNNSTPSLGVPADWMSHFKLAFGRNFAGIIGLVAIYDHVMPPTQIANNAKIKSEVIRQVRFDISAQVGVPASIVMDVKTVGDKAYSFSRPTLFTESTSPIALKGLQLGINGQVAQVGQAFSNIDVQASNGQLLSPGATLMMLSKGINQDTFAIYFDGIGRQTFTRTAVNYTPQAPVADGQKPGRDGIRDYQRIVQTYSMITGVSTNQRDIRYLYDTIRPMLPVRPNISGFNHTQQLSYTSLALNYCEKMVADDTKRRAFFTRFNPTQPVTGANFDALIADLFANTVGAGVDYQVTQTDMSTTLLPLVQAMQTQGSSPQQIATAACGTVLASAVVTVQ